MRLYNHLLVLTRTYILSSLFLHSSFFLLFALTQRVQLAGVSTRLAGSARTGHQLVLAHTPCIGVLIAPILCVLNRYMRGLLFREWCVCITARGPAIGSL